MLFHVLARKAYARNLQYRGSHALNTFASAIFGFIYVSIWVGIGENQNLGEYGISGMISYIAFNQTILSLTVFVTNGLGLEASVRSGQISIDMMRPVHLFYMTMSREWGQIGYHLVYKAFPIYLAYTVLLSMQLPDRFVTWLLTAAAVAFAAYISICIQYLIGVCALWTTESRWFSWVNYALSTLLSGFLIPIEWLPGWLQAISRYSFYPYLQYYPARIYLEYDNGIVLLGSILWCAGLTAICLSATAIVRRKLEVQGG
ncbi:ABC-type uncharacterized transport system, permease component [Chlamydia abortus]|uniref:ABC transporter permease n=1 Tax=Paenibacillus residui TaxID=629724 RepID=A0ABW3D9A7_9BACL|nr:ABC-type uncharacterized transport system, permease component [Chlamydia abortus]